MQPHSSRHQYVPSSPLLISLKAPQVGILATAFPPSHARSVAFAVFASGAPLGAALGIALGGVLTQKTEYVSPSAKILQSFLTNALLPIGIHGELHSGCNADSLRFASLVDWYPSILTYVQRKWTDELIGLVLHWLPLVSC